MPLQASTDRDLDRAGERQRQSGARLLLIGGLLAAVGLLMLVAFESRAVDHAGIVVAALGSVPGLAGLALWVSGVVSRRASRHKPFA